MSQHDLLAAAARALRDETARSPRRIPLPRRRDAIVATLRGRRARSRRVSAVAIAMVTFFVAGGAWATVTGRLPIAKFVHALFAETSGPISHAMTDATSAVRAASVHHRKRDVVAPVGAPIVETNVAPNEPIPVRTTQLQPGAARAIRPPRVDPHDDLYRAAHLAQFIQHDPATAVSAWDRYLEAAPYGRFAVEAAYNRAISLARLGRYDEARRALAPFARGDHGPYRQREAQELVDRLPAP